MLPCYCVNEERSNEVTVSSALLFWTTCLHTTTSTSNCTLSAKHYITRIELITAHTADKAHQSPLITIEQTLGKTYPVFGGMTWFHLTLTHCCRYDLAPTVTLTWYWIPPKSNSFFHAHVPPFQWVLWTSVK